MGIDMFNNNNKRSVGYRGGDLQWYKYIVGDSFCFSPVNNKIFECLQSALYCIGISHVFLMVETWNSEDVLYTSVF